MWFRTGPHFMKLFGRKNAVWYVLCLANVYYIIFWLVTVFGTEQYSCHCA